MRPTSHPARRSGALELLAPCLLVILSGCTDPEPFGPESPGKAQPVPTGPAAASTNVWSPKAPMPRARSFLAAGVANGVVYAVGGVTGTTAEGSPRPNPATNSWRTVSPMLTARSFLSGGAINGRVNAMAGVGGSGNINQAYIP